MTLELYVTFSESVKVRNSNVGPIHRHDAYNWDVSLNDNWIGGGSAPKVERLANSVFQIMLMLGASEAPVVYVNPVAGENPMPENLVDTDIGKEYTLPPTIMDTQKLEEMLSQESLNEALLRARSRN